MTGGSVSSPDSSPRDAFMPVGSPAANPVGHVDDLEAQTLLLESGKKGSNPPPPPTSCNVTGGQGVATNWVEGEGAYPVLATFTTDNARCTAGDFTAMADFGDGHAHNGGVDITGGPGTFSVASADDSYTEEGQYTIVVTVAPRGGSGTALPGAPATVTDAPLQWNPSQPAFNWSAITGSNQPPTFTSTPDTQHTAEGAAVSLQRQANDLDHDPLTFGAVGLPPGLSISSSGLISGTMDYAAAEEGSNNGHYTVTAVVADGHGGSANESFNWVVTDTPQALVLPNPGDQTNAEGDSPSFDLAGSDPDGNPITYSASGLPPRGHSRPG
jgi:hypothetical protein